MPQPTTAEVPLDEHKAASFGPAGRASCRFGFQRAGCDRISLPRNHQGRKIATNNFGIREMSHQGRLTEKVGLSKNRIQEASGLCEGGLPPRNIAQS
jgi:hypothetical protein